MAGGEVVAAVEHHVGVGDERVEQRRIGPLLQRDDAHLGVDLAHALGRRLDLRPADARHAVRDLALQVGQVDRVVIDQRDAPDAGRAEVERHRRAEPAGADDQRMPVEQPLLALDADLVEQDVPRIAQQLVIVSWTDFHHQEQGPPKRALLQ